MKDWYAVTYKRTEYGKAIRKQYESHEINERMCNMRERTVRWDGICNTITGVLKDYYVLEIEID